MAFYPHSHSRVWLALDRKTRTIIGVHVGDRSRAGAQALWGSLPEA
jgi:IS1 family transposase